MKMCGINVSIGFPRKIIEMNKQTSHRGERSKFKLFKNIGLGSIRLPIQGLSEEFDMPFERDNKMILFNGEIYNYKELDSNAKSDIEVLHMNPIRFDGDFAYVIFDKNDCSLEITTDRFGKRQLYYKSENGHVLGISSEVKGLLEGEEKSNEYYFATIKRFGYLFGSNKTYIENIFRFMPGYKYKINSSGKIISKEKINWDSNSLIPKNHSKNLKELIELSIKRRLVSDVPIAFLYSGGLDSSIILYHLKQLKTDIKIFTIENEDDTEYAERYAKELGFKIEKIKINHPDYKKAIASAELMTDLGSTLQNYNLFEKVRQNGFKVVLTGDACDEVFRGYKRNYRADYIQNDIFNELIFYHFPRLDKLAMAHTVEYRSPYSADYIIDFGLSIPYEQGINKEFLRKIYKDFIPHYILNRKKVPLKRKDEN